MRAIACLAICGSLLACGSSPPPIAHDAPDAGPPAPPRDADGDGLVDENDVCPCEAEDVDGHDDADGCPDPDNDGDQITDVCDRCPDEAEVYNGNCDGDGCPDRARVCVERARIAILEHVAFRRGSARLDAASAPLLDMIAAAIVGNPQLTQVAILGEADPHERAREALATSRAQAVLEALVARGVPRERLVAEADLARVHDASDPPEASRRVRFDIRTIDGEPVPADEPSASRCAGPEGPSCEVPVCESTGVVRAADPTRCVGPASRTLR